MRKLLPIIGAVGLTAVLALTSTAVRAEISIPMPSSTPVAVSGIPTHIMEYLQVDGTIPAENGVAKNSCWHVNNASEALGFNGACAPTSLPTAGPGGTAVDMNVLHKYVDWVELPTGGGEEFYAGAGMRTILYRDAALVHNGVTGFFGPGTGPTIPNTNVTPGPGVTPNPVNAALFPQDCFTANQVPQYVFLTSKTYSLPLYAVINEGRNACSGYLVSGGTNQNGGAGFGDVNNAAIAYWARSIEVITHKLASSLGSYGGAAKSINNGMSIIRWDDEDYPAHRFVTGGVCTGNITGYGTPTASPPPNCTALGKPIATRGDNPFFEPYAGGSNTDDMDPRWVEGTRNLFRMPKRFGMQSIYNDAYDPTQLKYIMTPDRANVIGVMCENCMGRNGAGFWSLNAWENHVNSEIVANDWGVKFIMKGPGINSAADDVYVTASEWLGETMMPQGLVEMGQGSGTINSSAGISPLFWLVPAQPIADPVNLRFDPYDIGYDRNNAPTNYGVATLQKSGGGYVREFAHCYVGSSGTPRDLGACAAVVFHDAGTMPTLTGTYGYSWGYTGGGVITETQFGGGDNGTLTTSTSIPAPGTAEAAGTAFILTATN